MLSNYPRTTTGVMCSSICVPSGLASTSITYRYIRNPIIGSWASGRGDYPEAESYYRQALSLPMFATFSEAQQEFVATELRLAMGE